MYHWLLNVVMDTTTGDDIPGGIANGTNNILQEYREEFTVTFIAGIIVGLLITLLFRFIKYLIKLCKEDDTINKKTENEDYEERK